MIWLFGKLKLRKIVCWSPSIVITRYQYHFINFRTTKRKSSADLYFGQHPSKQSEDLRSRSWNSAFPRSYSKVPRWKMDQFLEEFNNLNHTWKSMFQLWRNEFKKIKFSEVRYQKRFVLDFVRSMVWINQQSRKRLTRHFCISVLRLG